MHCRLLLKQRLAVELLNDVILFHLSAHLEVHHVLVQLVKMVAQSGVEVVGLSQHATQFTLVIQRRVQLLVEFLSLLLANLLN